MLSSPMKISVPTPAASNPGTSTRPSIGPPSPLASISKKAPSSGDPSSALIAAKLPAAATTVATCGGESRLTSRTARTPMPEPMAISGASGPRTTPRLSVAMAASITPSSCSGCTAPAGLKPSAGECPPFPGRYLMTGATSSPDNTNSGSGHQIGVPLKPNDFGTVVKNQCCKCATAYWKK